MSGAVRTGSAGRQRTAPPAGGFLGSTRRGAVPLWFWAVGLAALAIVAFNVQGWVVLERTSRILERELGDRLEAVATTLALALESRSDARTEGYQIPDTRYRNAERPGREGLLSEALKRNDLFNVYVVNDRQEYVVNLRNRELVGQPDPVLELDMPAIVAAFSGIPTQSKLYRAGGYFLKSAYAPLEDSVGNIGAVLGVEADAGFFSVLTGFRRSLVVVNVLSLLAVIAVVVVSASLARHALRVEQAAGRANTLAIMGQMSAALAHEIKNPLAIIRAAAERLKKRYGTGGDDPAFDYIVEETDRLANAVSNYMGIGVSRPGEVELLDIGEVVRGVVRDMTSQASKHGVELVLEWPGTVEDGDKSELRHQRPECRTDGQGRAGGTAAVAGNRNELRQVFLNLVLNGIQARSEASSLKPQASGRVEVSGAVESKRGEAWVVVRVEDNGPGIEPGALRRVWEPFYTTRDKGSGLGLFVVRRIVEAHRGQVEISSRPGEGTVVEVRLPTGKTGTNQKSEIRNQKPEMEVRNWSEVKSETGRGASEDVRTPGKR